MVNQPGAGASSQQKDGVPTAPAEPTKPLTFEMKDKDMLVGGRKVVYESDLIAAKRNLEQQLESAQTVHNESIDRAKLDLSVAQTQVATTNAKLGELEKARTAGAVSTEDAAKLKVELDTEKARATTATGLLLDLRKRLLLATFPGQVTPAQLENKTPAQLDAFEEALKALASSRGGPGPYAVGGAGAGTGPMSDMDRAKQLLAGTPYRGTRNEPQK